MKAYLEIIRPGPFCTLQDLGRMGFQEYGFTTSGAADEHAFRWANALLGNPQNTPSLEITLGMFSAKFDAATQICICGANAKVFINNLEKSLWTVLYIEAGDILEIRSAKSGFKIYLSVKNGFIATRDLNSCSMNSRENLGANRGQAFNAKQTLEYKQPKTQKPYQAINNPKLNSRNKFSRTLAEEYIPDYSEPLELSVIPSPEFHYFSKTEQKTLFSNEYHIQVDSNRMGYRFLGEAINYNGPNIKSSGTTLGTIQIPHSGQPIVLLKDHQTIGGYPRIGTVSQLDCFKLSQKKPGEIVSFKLSNRDREEKKLRTFIKFFSDLKKNNF